MGKLQQPKPALSNVATRGSTVPGASAQLSSSDDEQHPNRLSARHDSSETRKLPDVRRPSKWRNVGSEAVRSGRSSRSGRSGRSGYSGRSGRSLRSRHSVHSGRSGRLGPDFYSDEQVNASHNFQGGPMRGWGNVPQRRHSDLRIPPEDHHRHQLHAGLAFSDHINLPYVATDMHSPNMNGAGIHAPGMNRSGICSQRMEMPGIHPTGLNSATMNAPGMFPAFATFPDPSTHSFHFPGSSGRRDARSPWSSRSSRSRRSQGLPLRNGKLDPTFESTFMSVPDSPPSRTLRDWGWGLPRRQRHVFERPAGGPSNYDIPYYACRNPNWRFASYGSKTCQPFPHYPGNPNGELRPTHLPGSPYRCQTLYIPSW